MLGISPSFPPPHPDNDRMLDKYMNLERAMHALITEMAKSFEKFHL